MPEDEGYWGPYRSVKNMSYAASDLALKIELFRMAQLPKSHPAEKLLRSAKAEAASAANDLIEAAYQISPSQRPKVRFD